SRRYPQSRDALYQLGFSDYLAGHAAASRGEFGQLLASDPYNLLAHFYLSVLDRRAGLRAAAAAQAKLYDEEKPDFGEGAIALAFLRAHPEVRPESVTG